MSKSHGSRYLTVVWHRCFGRGVVESLSRFRSRLAQRQAEDPQPSGQDRQAVANKKHMAGYASCGFPFCFTF